MSRTPTVPAAQSPTAPEPVDSPVETKRSSDDAGASDREAKRPCVAPSAPPAAPLTPPEAPPSAEPRYPHGDYDAVDADVDPNNGATQSVYQQPMILSYVKTFMANLEKKFGGKNGLPPTAPVVTRFSKPPTLENPQGSYEYKFEYPDSANPGKTKYAKNISFRIPVVCIDRGSNIKSNFFTGPDLAAEHKFIPFDPSSPHMGYCFLNCDGTPDYDLAMLFAPFNWAHSAWTRLKEMEDDDRPCDYDSKLEAATSKLHEKAQALFNAFDERSYAQIPTLPPGDLVFGEAPMNEYIDKIGAHLVDREYTRRVQSCKRTVQYTHDGRNLTYTYYVMKHEVYTLLFDKNRKHAPPTPDGLADVCGDPYVLDSMHVYPAKPETLRDAAIARALKINAWIDSIEKKNEVIGDPQKKLHPVVEPPDAVLSQNRCDFDPMAVPRIGSFGVMHASVRITSYKRTLYLSVAEKTHVALAVPQLRVYAGDSGMRG